MHELKIEMNFYLRSSISDNIIPPSSVLTTLINKTDETNIDDNTVEY
jgi:hypothetical protein